MNQEMSRRTLLEGRRRGGRRPQRAAGGRPGARVPRRPRRGGHPVAGPASAGLPFPDDAAAGVGGARLLPHARRRSSSSSATTATPPWMRRPGAWVSAAWSPSRCRCRWTDLKARPRREVTFTLECSGNHGFPFVHRRDRERPLGGHAAGAAAASGPGFSSRAPRSCSGAPIPGRSRSATTAAWSGSRSGQSRRARCPRTRPDDHRAVRPQHVARGGAERRQPAVLRDERRAAASRARVPAAPDRAGLVRGGQREVADAHRGDGPALRGPLHGARLRDASASRCATARPSGRSTPSSTTG